MCFDLRWSGSITEESLRVLDRVLRVVLRAWVEVRFKVFKEFRKELWAWSWSFEDSR